MKVHHTVSYTCNYARSSKFTANLNSHYMHMAIIAIVSWISQSNILYIYNKIMKVDFLKKSKKTNKK